MSPRMVSVTAVVILLLTGSASQTTDNCGTGWMLLNSSCYQLSLEPKNWSSALTSCQEKDADLVSLESWTEQKLSEMELAASEGIWWVKLQSNSSESKGMFLYDNSSFSGEIILWNDGEPNNVENHEYCVEMYPTGKLNDVPCERQQFYICKKYLKRVNHSRNSCDRNWIMILDSCYKLYGQNKQWKDAQRKCNEDGANLLTLESLDELLQIRNEMYHITSIVHWWVGLQKISDGNWQWFGKPPMISPAITQWKKDVLITEDCLVMDSDGFLSGMPCDSSLFFICVKSNNCESEWIGRTPFCYKLSNKTMSWSGAQETCKAEGTNLLIVRTLSQLIKIQNDIDMKTSPWWVGVRRTSPSNEDLKQDKDSQKCGMIASNNSLVFTDCTALHSYICQKTRSKWETFLAIHRHFKHNEDI
ncbi:secretory phospholipase A2 receptor-like [Pomacea canaliculata]|uniref:secretory phospholipase A2 receptor-like n=1 Tax=Pomacea canaliculata TaxID=400727 RepID=UPI000D72FE54|nr:secretory phospholipase A2 receptor-like [Pomacea canaliculata]